MNDMSNSPRLAKVFWSGRSQAVRLPKDFRFDTSEVRIRREGDQVILEPVRDADDTRWIDRIAGTWDEDAAARALDRGGAAAAREPISLD